MNYYDVTVPAFIRILSQTHRWFDKAKAHADQKKYDVNVLLPARLAPDQFHFARQIQGLSDQIKGAVARLAGVQPPSFEDNEKTVDELRARVDKTIAFLKTLKPEQFQGAAERTITLPFIPGKGLKGSDYLTVFVLPNVYFHATTAYAILRHNGIDVGKADFIGDLPLFDVPKSA
ncbi:DUF1993 family protein [Vitiosangium sp. GDMCC 1.1324]|uniref:DUF1993 domain-containing protein n=1 Tax=Vitiosangium sp. (strain GDMCC 1.1324) TaxID=2138576 RepID=UPI000D3A48C4|nr:DUF1993 domain-containing protein [Vitiosangium sp. GDMCC 1.1324]PTL77229.1 DUF1993 domain-containing protein [Vitiosangium sp. GDMCC 1.1324]